jgi:DNA-binding HxlR family transcriptional regulator
MAKRYDQFCPVAHGLSMVGERWALLVVRELLKGPRRYTDLVAGLPGIGTNVLATRLRELEAGGVVAKRRLPPPAASTVYELTPYGEGLEEAVHAIARWGARSLGPPPEGEPLDPEWGLSAFPALLYPERARGLTQTTVIAVDDTVFTVRLDDGRLAVEIGETDDADLIARIDLATMFDLASGDLPAADAVAAGRVQLEAGDTEALTRFFHVFSYAPRLGARADEDEPRLGARVRVEALIPSA